MKREVILLGVLLSLFLILPFVFADEQTQVDEAYACLEEKVANQGCSSLSLEEKAFTLMAIQECEDELAGSASSNACWPNPNCNVKSTAQAIFALNGVNEETTNSENWLLSHNSVPANLEWFLEIETSEPTTCIISYNDLDYQISVSADRKILGNTGSCLSLAQDGYWLKISSNCFNMDIYTTCQSNNFITTLLFKRQGSSTVHISKDVHSAAGGGLTKEKVNSLCFSSGLACDYEGSLWASLALYAKGHDISAYMPYLITMAPENEEFLPESFIYFLTGKMGNQILSKQKLNQFWDESGDKYYDTALAAWPFYWEEPIEWINAKNWLLENQGTDGCWSSGNLRNTAFILRSFWPEYFTPPECRTNSDCPDGEQCIDEQCVVPGEICGDGIAGFDEQCDGSDLNEKICEDFDSDWTGSLSCDSDCVFDTSGCYLYVECEDDEDCSGIQVCVNGVCKYPDNPEYECIFNSDCTGVQICVNGECVNPEPPPEEGYCGDGIQEDWEQCDGNDLNDETCETAISNAWKGNLSCDSDCFLDTSECIPKSECEDDYDCPGDQICVSGSCLTPSNGSETKKCETSYDCYSYQQCIDGFCVDNEYYDCEEEGYFCMSESNCLGTIYETYSNSCYSPFICCSEDLPLESCSSQGGEICYSDEICDGGIEKDASNILSSETCCVGGTCVEESSEDNLACEDNSGICRYNCNNDEKETLQYTCDYGESCCLKDTQQKKKKTWLIWVLLILIVLATLGIIFRDKLRPFWFKLKSKFTKGKKPSLRRPGMPLRPMPVSQKKPPFFKKLFSKKKPLFGQPSFRRPFDMRKPMPPQGRLPQRKPIQFRKPGEKPKPNRGELDNVLKKLRDMSK